MNWSNKAALGSLVALLGLTGCRHQARIALMPNPPVLSVSVPPPTHHIEPLPLLELEDVPSLRLQVPYVALPRFRPKPATARQLASLLPPAPPPMGLGELSTGGESSDSELRLQTETLLRVQQQRLQSLPQTSTVLHSQQVEQASLFLHQALEAWRNHDIEGARVLAMKTKLLLDEI